MAVLYERRDAAAILTIDRPERRNAVDGDTARELYGRFREFVDDDGAKVLIVTGGGGKAFCAGADLKAMSNPIGDTPREGARKVDGPMGFTRAHSPKPTIAAVEGWCVAGGLEIACWCDVRIAAQSATFGCLERRWGVPLCDGGTLRLPRIVGSGRALDLIMTGRTIDANEALTIGLANRVVPDGTALDAALAYAEQIAGYPWECVLSDRQSLYQGYDMPLADALANEGALGRTVMEAAGRGALRFASGAGRHGVQPAT